MTNRLKLTPKNKEKFLNLLKDLPNVSRAAAAIGMTTNGVYQHRRAHPEFKEAWDEAVTIGLAKLEEAAWNRAVEGAKKPIIHQGQITGWYHEPSDKLMSQLLRANLLKYRNDHIAVKAEIEARHSADETVSAGDQLRDMLDSISKRSKDVEEEDK